MNRTRTPFLTHVPLYKRPSFYEHYNRLAHTNLLREPEGGTGSHCTEGWRICFGTPDWDSVEGESESVRPLVCDDKIDQDVFD